MTVHCHTANITAAVGSDYTAASGDVTIPAGQTSTQRLRTGDCGLEAGGGQDSASPRCSSPAAASATANSAGGARGGPAVLDPGAIELRRTDGSLVGADVSITLLGGKTVAALTFAGPEFVGGSLADGNYTLTVRADRVHDRWGRELDGDGDGSAGGNRADAFFRLFGDSDGDRDVDLIDLGRFLTTFGRRQGDPHFLGYMDFNGDERVGLLDLLAFARRLGTHLNP